MGMDLHVNNITRSCFYQLIQLRSIRRSITMEASKTLVHSLISSRVDYCSNSIFYGATNAVLRKLQSVLNAAVRLITNTRKYDHITAHACAQRPTSLATHPPTHHFQNCNLRSKFAPRPRPNVSQSILHPHLGNRGESLPSFCCTERHLTTPRTRTRRFGPRSFRVSGSVVWNSLPDDIRNPELTLERFKTGLKTHLFREAYA